jgi:hypothetical protein
MPLTLELNPASGDTASAAVASGKDDKANLPKSRLVYISFPFFYKRRPETRHGEREPTNGRERKHHFPVLPGTDPSGSAYSRQSWKVSTDNRGA